MHEKRLSTTQRAKAKYTLNKMKIIILLKIICDGTIKLKYIDSFCTMHLLCLLHKYNVTRKVRSTAAFIAVKEKTCLETIDTAVQSN